MIKMLPPEGLSKESLRAIKTLCRHLKSGDSADDAYRKIEQSYGIVVAMAAMHRIYQQLKPSKDIKN